MFQTCGLNSFDFAVALQTSTAGWQSIAKIMHRSKLFEA